MSKFVENFKKFAFAILILYVITVPVSSSFAETGASPLFQQGINALTIFTTVILLMAAFFQYRSDKDSIKTEPYLIITALIYLLICLVSAVLAEQYLEHCLARVFTLFCFLNNAFWPHILFPKLRQVNILTRTVIFGSLILSSIYAYIWVIRGGSFNRYDYNNFGDAFGLSPELGFAYDPNIMLFGFIYGIVCLFTIYSERPLPQLWQKILVVAQGLIIFTFLIFLFSRTTAISLVLTVVIFLTRRFYRNHRFWIVLGIIAFFVIVSLPELTELINKSEFYANVTEGREISNEDRVFRLEYSVGLWLSNLKSIIIGRGYGIEILEFDPHNIYLTHMYSNGLMGFFAFAAFVFSIKYYGKQLTPKENSIIDLSMIYIGIGAMTYWHNKSMWVIFMLCLMRTSAYRARHQIPTTTFDFEENPVTQIGSQVKTFLTDFFTPGGKFKKKRSKKQLTHKKSTAKKAPVPQRKKAPRIKVQTPAWAEQKQPQKTAFDFEDNPITKLGKRLTNLLTGLRKQSDQSPNFPPPPSSKKMRQMKDRQDK